MAEAKTTSWVGTKKTTETVPTENKPKTVNAWVMKANTDSNANGTNNFQPIEKK